MEVAWSVTELQKNLRVSVGLPSVAVVNHHENTLLRSKLKPCFPNASLAFKVMFSVKLWLILSFYYDTFYRIIIVQTFPPITATTSKLVHGSITVYSIQRLVFRNWPRWFKDEVRIIVKTLFVDHRFEWNNNHFEAKKIGLVYMKKKSKLCFL